MSELKPVISVIMPVYNRENYVAEAIESILQQSYRNFEFIIIDDGSTDSSVSIIEKYGEEDNRIILICNEENRGNYYSRNLGNMLARGEFLAVMDSDDISLPTRLEQQLQFFTAHPDIDALGTQAVEIDQEGNRLHYLKYPLTYGQVRWGLIFGRSLCHPSIMARKKCFDKLRISYTEKQVSQDFDLLVRLSNLVRIENLPDALLLIRKHPDSISNTNKTTQLDEAYNSIRSNVKGLINQELPDEVISRLVLARHQKKHPEIGGIKSALIVSSVLISLMQQAMTWDISAADRFCIRQNTASRLRHIWITQKYHPFLLPYVIYSILLDPDVIRRKIRELVSIIRN